MGVDETTAYHRQEPSAFSQQPSAHSAPGAAEPVLRREAQIGTSPTHGKLKADG
jgi:hypothetical protein